MKVYEGLARALAERGVDRMFGLIGDANLFMVDSFIRDRSGTYVGAANEAGAVLMAMGYAAVSGKVGVATVTHGPGLTNSLTPLVEAVKAATPMVLLTGDTPVEDKENLQNVNQREFILATGAGFEQLRSPRTMYHDLDTAFRRAWIERRPVVLNIPAEFQWQDTDYAPVLRPLVDHRAIVAEGDEIDNAIGIIAAARRPVIVAGRGAIEPDSRAAILRLAARIGAPVGTTLKAKGLFAGEPRDLGIFGTLSSTLASEIILQSDCVIAFGAGLNRHTASHGTFLDGKRIIQINLEQQVIGHHQTPAAGVVGHPAKVADLFVDWLDRAEIAPSGFFTPQMQADLAAFDPVAGHVDLATATTFDEVRMLQWLNAELPPDRIVVTDAGRFVGEAWKLLDVPDARSSVLTVHFGAIGLGVSQAIGAAVAAPGRPVLTITGDGGFVLGGLVEFTTAVRHNTDLIVVVMNDCSYGMEHIQYRRRDMDPSLSMFDWPDFAPVAEAMGGRGLTVRSAADLAAVRQAIKDRDRPLLIDVKLHPDRMPEPPR